MIKKALVTGGAGLIGSHLVKRLVNEGYNVSIIDNLERGRLEYLGEQKDRVTFLKLDLRDAKICEDHINSSYDIVYHLASKVGGIGVYLSQPYTIMKDNLLIDSNVLNAVVKNKIPKYFYASSAHIYPKQLQDSPNSAKIKEGDDYPADPELTYGWAKLTSEKMILSALCENPWLSATIGRFIGIYGPNQDYELETGSVIPVFSHRAIKYPDTPFAIKGTGQETRSYCFIDDAIDCMILCDKKMDSLSCVGPINIGKEEAVSINQIAEIIIEISGKKINIDYDKSQKTVIWGQLCDLSNTRTLLGWEASTPLKKGLEIVYKDIIKRINK